MVRTESSVRALDLRRLLQDLSFVDAPPGVGPGGPALELSVLSSERPLPMPTGDRDLFHGDGLRAIAAGGDVYVTEGTSLLHLEARQGRATARIAPGFLAQPNLVRQRFWAIGLLALLRARDLYGLHAAGLVDPSGAGVLLVGPSGSGKSTLALGLVRDGWQYLSDDAVLLRARQDGIGALALRRPFSVVRGASVHMDRPPGPASQQPPGARKRRVDVQSAYPAQHRSECRPATLVFPRIVGDARSTLRPLPRITALGRLLAQSGHELFDRPSMPRHVELLGRLVRQAAGYELCAGGDLHRRPAMLADLLADAREGRHGANHHRAHEPL